MACWMALEIPPHQIQPDIGALMAADLHRNNASRSDPDPTAVGIALLKLAALM
jgi:hypothetical protein